jgi:hypothetical protein
MEQFSVSDISNNLDEETRGVMLDLILSWARYDGLISQWVLLAYGLTPDAGSLLLGNMDTRTKLDRLKALYEHHSMQEGVARIAALQKGHAHYVDIRNAIAHSACGGQNTSEPKRVLFAPVKTIKGQLGKMLMEQIHIDLMREAAKFAGDAGDKLLGFTDALLMRRSPPPPEPPELAPGFRPSPQRKGGNKRPTPPRSSRA